MKRNGMCPICYIKQFFFRPTPISRKPLSAKYDNGVALTPPMGWSTWNCFHNHVSAELILEMAQAMKEKGLIEAGYRYMNVDDCWQSSLRSDEGKLVADYETFPDGIESLVSNVNAMGMKLGLYTSNGYLTCEDLPASLGREKIDAMTLARWGVEYFKYDFCHHEYISQYAPLVYSVSIFSKQSNRQEYFVNSARLEGLARLMTSKKIDNGKYVSGLDKGLGSVIFEAIEVPKEGEYILTVNILKKGAYKKYLIATVNDEKEYEIDIPEQKHYNITARFQVPVYLKKGKNTIRLENPVRTKADSEYLQYRRMGIALSEATKQAAREKNEAEKPIVYSICEWGWGKPWQWGAAAGNLWRTTPDINTMWTWICMIYNLTATKYQYSSPGHWNDPDMLEVGIGKLNHDENVAHFSVWCMLNAPLILGADIRSAPSDVLDIVTNRNLIAINQDPLGRQAKRIKKGGVDILAKPLSDGSVAVCFFNKFGGEKRSSLKLSQLINDEYVRLTAKSEYLAVDQWLSGEQKIVDRLEVRVPRHSVKVFRIY